MLFRFSLPVLSICLLFGAGCQKNPQIVTDIPGLEPGIDRNGGGTIYTDGEIGDGPGFTVIDPENNIGKEDITGSEPEEPISGFSDTDELTLSPYTIYFGFDSSSIDNSEFAKLDDVYSYLVNNPDVQIRLEGHCDERGTSAYNLALGQSRAASAREYLIDSGIAVDRLSTLSWGEDKLATLDTTEAAHALNRRVQFVILK